MPKWLQDFWNNPILVKEFRSRMRTLKTPIMLLLYLLVIGGLIFGFIYMTYANRSWFRPGESKTLFIFLAVLQMILVAFVAPGLTAGTISGERERQTLNILLTTHLSPWKIVLSKMTASLSFITLLVFATLPLYAIVFLYGGVSPSQLLTVFGYYLMCMILFGSIGMFCSAWVKRTGVSTVLAYALTFFILGGTALIAVFALEYMHMRDARALIGVAQPSHPEIFYVSALNPVLNLVGIFEPDYVMMGQGRNPATGVQTTPMATWLYFMIVYMPLSAILIISAVRMLMPVKRPLFGRSKAKTKQSEAGQ